MTVFVSLFYFFFFKQKTAYEMRISDWSSDVCSSDLGDALQLLKRDLVGLGEGDGGDFLGDQAAGGSVVAFGQLQAVLQDMGGEVERGIDRAEIDHPDHHRDDDLVLRGLAVFAGLQRSEEHTSELQSLMRISYAVFCLKKKK